MAGENEKTVIVEQDKRSSSPLVAVIIIVGLVLLALFGLPYLTGGNGSSSTEVEVTPPAAGQ